LNVNHCAGPCLVPSGALDHRMRIEHPRCRPARNSSSAATAAGCLLLRQCPAPGTTTFGLISHGRGKTRLLTRLRMLLADCPYLARSEAAFAQLLSQREKSPTRKRA
jgi:hypothetical protein